MTANYNTRWSNYRPLENIVMTTISEFAFPFVEFDHLVRVPKDCRYYASEWCKKSVRVGNYKSNIIYTLDNQRLFYMKNGDKFYMLEVLPNKNEVSTLLREELTDIFKMFYQHPHKDWGLLFEIYKLRELL